MTLSELNIPEPSDREREKYWADCTTGAPVHGFEGLKSLLTSMGYNVGESSGYRAIPVEDVTAEQINSGFFEFTNDGIFVTVDGVRRQVFLYKRSYRLTQYGKPRFHVRQCQTILSFMNSTGNIPAYRRANTDTVKVLDMDDGGMEKEVSTLPLCKYCADLIQSTIPMTTTTEFVEMLRDNEEDTPMEDIEVDLFGYTRDWEIISRGIRERNNYTCELCGLHISNPYDQHFIHVHHKNGRKTDNRDSNLQCLCLRCHADVDANHKERLTGSRANRIIYDEFCAKYPNNGTIPEDYDEDLPF